MNTMTETQPIERIEKAPVLITGMSGAGINSAARVLEDLGWYVSHNLPPELIFALVELYQSDESPVDKLAVVTDVRAREFRGNLYEVVDKLRSEGKNPTVLFMEARDEVLIKRFDSVRRTHPLQGRETLKMGIERERKALARIKEEADIVIDTSDLSVHDLRHAIENSFATLAHNRQHITVQSFGFKHGAPADADYVVDVRFLPNPYWVPELRAYRGVDAPVSDYVLSQEDAEPFISNLVNLITNVTPAYRREGKNFITVAVGCTGGHHRSVAVAEELARRFDEVDGLDVSVTHRDINRS
ncbi:RNase adapter RapZ [Corynebacterium durum]|uniref:RNase adapter RapZ n=1 Tax=Corynebacterium durum TaxID=61592 RepID=UPI0036243BB9